MSKYIDADHLRKEVEWRLNYIETATGDYAEGRRCELRYLLSIIDVPRQEQPDDICKEGKVECSHIMKEFLNNFIEIGNTFNFGFGPKDIHQEQPEIDLEKASRNVYESWMGGTMDDVRRDMVELGKALNARKEEKK